MTQSADPTGLDLNLLLALDVLLEEQSVRGAARRLHLSEPATSRTLGRIRKALGDPILVRAGRAMVPTPYALPVRAEVGAVVERARALFASGPTDPSTVERTFTVLGQDALAATLGPALLARAGREAPGVRLRFLNESRTDAPTLREGVADLEIGVIDTVHPEVRTEHLLDDRMTAVVRAGHPLLRGRLTRRRFAVDADHLVVSRRGRLHGPIDTALAEHGLRRRVVAGVGTYPASLFLLRDTDLVGLIGARSRSLAESLGLVVFEVPLDLPPLPLGLAWHPRHDADPAHAWLRGCVRDLLLDRSG
ncbi:LysR family transcriptional regulator [Streptomyces sp. NPDC004520]|uniref:LysR family transcriptional regulator n=1 Tax=Streptomyces sp. NPDC004520 TaxID=3364702 RepID=UPI00367B245A